MKALITAGGKGTRLRPITFTINKHLIPLANKPMIFYALEKVAEAGIKEVGININEGDKEIPQALGDGSKWGIKLTFIEQKGGPLGLAHIIKNAKDFLKDEEFVFYLGDNIILGGIKKFIDKFHKDKLNCLLALSKVKDPERFGVPEIDEKGRIVKIEEKPEKPKSQYAVTGIYIYDSSILEAVENIKPSHRGEYEISDAHTYLIEKGYKVGYEEITGWWKDTGKPWDLLEGNQLILESSLKPEVKGEIESQVILEGRVKIEEGSKIKGKSFIRGPALIGKNTVIHDSYIGSYTSIGNNVEIYNAEIEHSIVFDYADINTETRIVDSLIGVNATITDANQTKPSGHKLIIGDQAVVEL